MTAHRSRTGLLCVLFLWLPVAGCNRTRLPPAADPEQARAALQEALAAWQRGESSESLAARRPPLYFNDPKCDTARLLGFTLEDGHTTHGQSVRLSAVLSLQLKDGARKEKKVAYLIDTSPATVIVPD